MALAHVRTWLLVGSLLAACGDDGGSAAREDAGRDRPDGGGDAGAAQPAKWTVFMYGHGDHNLSNSLVRDIAEMAQAKLRDDVQVVVLADFDATQTIADGSGERFPSGAHWLQVEGNGAEPIEVDRERERDFDDPQTLADAVATALVSFPAEHYAVILWDHGGAWSGGFGGDTQDGTRQGAPMSAAQVADALRAGMEAADVTQPLDILAFDTCLMGGVEVAAEFRELAEVFIADAEIDYGDGWDYTGFLGYLAQNPDADVRTIARREVALWDAHHAKAGDNDRLLRSHIALDLRKLDAFQRAYATVSSAFLASDAALGPQLGRAAYFALPPYMNQLSTPSDTPELRDVGQFLGNLMAVESPALVGAAAAAREAAEGATLASSQGTLRKGAGQLGLHVELPLATHLTRDLLDSYRTLSSSWVALTAWDQALQGYAALDDGQLPQLTTSIRNADGPTATTLPVVSLQAPDVDVAEVEVNLGLIDPQQTGSTDEVLFYGLVAKGAIQPATAYDLTWSGQLLTLPDGQGGQQPVFMRAWEDTGTAADAQPAVAPLLATFGQVDTRDGESVLGALLFQDGDAETGLLALFEPAITLSLAQVASDLPGSTFTPVLQSIALGTGLESAYVGTPIPLDAASLPLGIAPAPVGNYALLVSVTDVFGNLNSDLEVVHVTTPVEASP